MFGVKDDQVQNHEPGQMVSDGALNSDDQTTGAPVVTNNSDLGFVNSTAPVVSSDTETPPEVVNNPAPVVPSVNSDISAAATDTDQLLDIKQQALQQLTPLIGHLEQDPEEKFRTTMMMIQASDNDGLIKNAYDAALQITDEKVRAQALLDIVNEINYFTHNNNAEV
jgi:hypothetical protein